MSAAAAPDRPPPCAPAADGAATMAKILKQLSAMPGRLFPAEPPEKQRPPELFIDADALDVYALRRCQSDLSPLYLTRLSVSTDDLHAATLPPPRGLIDALHEFRVKGRGVMRRVRGGADRERSANAVSRSDSFKFQSPEERRDNNIVPPRRRGRKKGARPPSMPQVSADPHRGSAGGVQLFCVT